MFNLSSVQQFNSLASREVPCVYREVRLSLYTKASLSPRFAVLSKCLSSHARRDAPTFRAVCLVVLMQFIPMVLRQATEHGPFLRSSNT